MAANGKDKTWSKERLARDPPLGPQYERLTQGPSMKQHQHQQHQQQLPSHPLQHRQYYPSSPQPPSTKSSNPSPSTSPHPVSSPSSTPRRRSLGLLRSRRAAGEATSTIRAVTPETPAVALGLETHQNKVGVQSQGRSRWRFPTDTLDNNTKAAVPSKSVPTSNPFSTSSFSSSTTAVETTTAANKTSVESTRTSKSTAERTPYPAGWLSNKSSTTDTNSSVRHEWDSAAQSVDRAGTMSPSLSRAGTRPSKVPASSGYTDTADKKHHTRDVQREPTSTVRPRTRTLDDRGRRQHSPTALARNRNRIGSVTEAMGMPLYRDQSQDRDFLSSMHPNISHSTSSSISSPGSPERERSFTPASSDAGRAVQSNLPEPGARRIFHLMHSMHGRMSGDVYYRWGTATPWVQAHCFVQEDTTSLIYEPKNGDGSPRILLPELRGCVVRPAMDGDTPYLDITLPQPHVEVHIKVPTQADLDAWFATFLYWQSRPNRSFTHESPRSPPTPVHGHEEDSTAGPSRPLPTEARDRNNSVRSVRRQSLGSSTKEPPVIKIGKMVFWDSNVRFPNTRPGTGAGPGSSSSPGPQVLRVPSQSSKRWRRISGQLRENGELKLHADVDNSLISVVQLSQLSRCAIQRLDMSVLDCEFCIAIYPQYAAYPNASQADLGHPIFLSLESRVLYEVWFVLLRAFTIPQLYGPSSAADVTEHPDGENLLATTTTDMFRVERSLNVRVIEAKYHPPMGPLFMAEHDASGGHPKGLHAATKQTEGYYTEILLDGETRAKTVVKHDGPEPLWGESFEFLDLPPILNSASILLKRRPPDPGSPSRDTGDRAMHDGPDAHDGHDDVNFDTVCGKVEITLQELEEADKEIERWWPLTHSSGQRIGEILVKARADEGVVLMARDYQPLSDLLHRFSNNLTLQIAQIASGDLKRLCDCFLNIYQVSGRASDWIMSLIEEEIDGIHKETPVNRLRYSRRVGSNELSDSAGAVGANADRELIVRDLNKNATLEANLLFRGNTLLTKSLDAHMRRVGKEYLEEALSATIKDINDKDLDCEVDPNRIPSSQDLDRNWRRLLLYTQEVWKAIVAAKPHCPIELRVLFRHIRACAEDRYGDFLRIVSFSSVSGFLFLRFFCPAVLNPKLFYLIKDDIKPRTRRTLTLIAKSLQTLANMASFGTKEHWMEPMNAFLTQHRENFKSFINDICYVPAPLSGATGTASSSGLGTTPAYMPGFVSTGTHLSYTTPMTIMQRLPPTSREGFPSLPYLIDQTRAFADLVQLWLEVTNEDVESETARIGHNKKHFEVLQAIEDSGPDLVAFHRMCINLNLRTQECLSRAERAERPSSATSFRWEDLLDQLQNRDLAERNEIGDAGLATGSFEALAERIASDPTILPPGMAERFNLQMASRMNSRARRNGEDSATSRAQTDRGGNRDDRANNLQDGRSSARSQPMSPELEGVRIYNTTPPGERAEKPSPGNTKVASSLSGTFRRALHSRGSDQSPMQSASASPSNLSSNVNSDGEHTTALPSYENEVRRHRERREAAKQQIQHHVEEARHRQQEKERRKAKTPLAALRKRKEKNEPQAGDSNLI